MSKIRAENAAAEVAARQRLTKAAGPILDELASIEQAGHLLGTGIVDQIEGHVEELLMALLDPNAAN